MQELISNGSRRVYFWSWAPGGTRFQYYSPPLRSRDFKQPVGDFVASVFVPGTTQAGPSDAPYARTARLLIFRRKTASAVLVPGIYIEPRPGHALPASLGFLSPQQAFAPPLLCLARR